MASRLTDWFERLTGFREASAYLRVETTRKPERWKVRRRTNLASHASTADVLDGMTWQQFERLVGEAFRLQGFRVTETGGGGPTEASISC